MIELGKVQNVYTNVIDCSVVIQWTPPEVGASQVNNYQVEVRNQDGFFMKIDPDACKNSVETSTYRCHIQMSDLGEGPYNLAADDPILFAVTPVRGDGNVGPTYEIPLSSAPNMKSQVIPPKVTKLQRHVYDDPNNIALQWNDVLAEGNSSWKLGDS
jgi:hypothetical protein